MAYTRRVRLTIARCRAIKLLGNRCSEPGCKRTTLQIHHPDDDGATHRAKFGGFTPEYYEDILKCIEDKSRRLELLCSSCHARREIFYCKHAPPPQTTRS